MPQTSPQFHDRTTQHRFTAWELRKDNLPLRDAWLATQAFIQSSNWEHLFAECVLCKKYTRLRLRAPNPHPDLREDLICATCGMNTRIRAALTLLQQHLPNVLFANPRMQRPSFLQRLLRYLKARLTTPHHQVYLTEQATTTFAWMQRHLAALLHGSEFEPRLKKRIFLSRYLYALGGYGMVNFRDVTALDFADQTLDAIVSFDVLEHVPDYHKAIAEFARSLKPGGVCIATFPFTDQPQTLTRARLNASGDIEHLEPAEYHGDPISGGVLCFYHFGWDILDAFHAAGFRHAEMRMPYALEHGIPYGMWTLYAQR